MKTRAAVLAAVLLAACASAPPPPGPVIDASRLSAAAVPGQATRASVLAALGPAQVQAFDNGYQVWAYQLARGGGRYQEAVLLFDPEGLLRKARRGPEP